MYEREVHVEPVYSLRKQQQQQVAVQQLQQTSALPSLTAVTVPASHRRSISPDFLSYRSSRATSGQEDVTPFDEEYRRNSGSAAYRPTESPDHSPRSPGTEADSQGGSGKRDLKFPYHLDHKDPEDDDKATRTLFVGNLYYEVSEQEIRYYFEKYGIIEDVDIKRPNKGSGNAYAFIRYMNLDMAHRAKVDMSGRYIKNFQCKIGYGKVTPTRCLWVGGLGPWIQYDKLEKEFDRFGVIEKIEWPQGKNYAYILFGSVDAAMSACNKMRGYPLGGNEKRIRVDFGDEEHIYNDPSVLRRKQGGGGLSLDFRTSGAASSTAAPTSGEPDLYPVSTARESSRYREDYDDSASSTAAYPSHYGSGASGNYYHRGSTNVSNDRSDSNRDHRGRRGHVTSGTTSGNGSVTRNMGNSKPFGGALTTLSGRRSEDEPLTMETATNVIDLAKCLDVAWTGAFRLKAASFPCRIYVLKGEYSLIEQFMGDGVNNSSGEKYGQLNITQRMKLDPIKLDDVHQRIVSAGNNGFSILLAMPLSTSAPPVTANETGDEENVQLRPLKNLVTYLRQKGAAGVVFLNGLANSNGDTHEEPSVGSNWNNNNYGFAGILHAFPPCDFAYNLLTQCASKLEPDFGKDDHMVMLLIRSSNQP